MTIGQLKEELEYLIDHEGLSEGTEVRIASQPNWPFENTVDTVGHARGKDGEPALFIGEGSQIGYLGDEAREVLGWGSDFSNY